MENTNLTRINAMSKFLKIKITKTAIFEPKASENSFVEKLVSFRGYVKFIGRKLIRS